MKNKECEGKEEIWEYMSEKRNDIMKEEIRIEKKIEKKIEMIREKGEIYERM